MNKTGTDPAPDGFENAGWTLIRGARQLLTLRGASGPRRGSAMSDLNIIADGAVLIRDGFIVEAGTTRRVENLVPARSAREFDASGKVVMPAFVDPDVAIAASGIGEYSIGHPYESDIRLMSRRCLETIAKTITTDLVRYGVLTIGASTSNAPDLKNTLKALRLHQALESKTLRIRSVFAPRGDMLSEREKRAADLRGLWGLRTTPPQDPHSLDMRGLWGRVDSCITNSDQCQHIKEIWMPSIFRKKLASHMEIPVVSGRIQEARAMASAAAAIGFNIRFRVAGPTDAGVLELACSAGAVALICPVANLKDTPRVMAESDCVVIVPGTRILAGSFASKRRAIDEGIPIALASGYTRERIASLNPQFLLFLACHVLGMTVEEAIVAATYNAACSLGLSHITGSLAPGKAADLCVMDVDDYRELARRAGHHDASLVIRAGKVVYRRQTLTTDFTD